MIKQFITKLIIHQKHRERLFIAFLGVTIFVCAYLFGQASELYIYDAMTKVYTNVTARQKSIADDRIILVVIDDESIKRIGRWPWPRKLYIELFDYIQNYGKAKVIAFDSIIKGADACNIESDAYFYQNLDNFPTLIAGLGFTENVGLSSNQSYKKHFEKFALKNVNDQRYYKESIGTYNLNSLPSLEYLNAVSALGSVLTAPDEDKKIRTITHIKSFDGMYFPSLSLGSIIKYYNADKYNITIDNNKIILDFGDDKRVIPFQKTKKNYLSDFSRSTSDLLQKNEPPQKNSKDKKIFIHTWIKWYTLQPGKTHSHHAISAYKVLEALKALKSGNKPVLNPDVFKDKIVVVGAAAAGVEDIKATPLFPSQPGVDIQATNISNILNADFMVKQPVWVNTIILISLVGLTFALTMILNDMKISVIAVLTIAASYFLFVLYVLYPHNIIVDTATPVLFIFLTPMIVYTHRFTIEKLRKSQIEGALSKLVSSDVMSELMKDPENIKLGGQKKNITILFSDIRGFTALSERLTPEEISTVLNEYFNVMEPIIKKNKGILDKFMGDGIMALFGAPVERNDHAYLATKAALEMVEALKDLNTLWQERNIMPFDVGIGINTGSTFVGQVGSIERMEYTAIGDAVNIASRIEELTKTHQTAILMSESTYQSIKNAVDVRFIENALLKGKSESVNIYEVTGIKDVGEA